MKLKILKLAVPFLLIIISTSLKSQVLTKGDDLLYSNLGFIEIIGADDPTIKGDIRLFDDWKKCDLNFSIKRSMNDVLVNLDLYHSQLLLYYKKKKFSVGFNMVDSLHIEETNQKLINSSNLEGMAVDLPLFVHYDSHNLGFYEKPGLKIIKPSYNRELDIGTRDTKIVSEFEYLIYDKKNQSHFFFKPNKNGIKSFENYKALREHMKENNYKPDNREHMIALIKFYELEKYK